MLDRALALVVVVLWSLFFPNAAHADYSAREGFGPWTGGQSDYVFIAGAQAKCAAVASAAGFNDSQWFYPHHTGRTDIGDCQWDFRGSPPVNWAQSAPPHVYMCGTAASPTNITTAPHTCTGSDPVPPTCPTGRQPGSQGPHGKITVNTTFCIDGCTASPDFVSGDATANKYFSSNYTYSGANCTAGGSTPALPAAGPAPSGAPSCSAGQCLGTVNGNYVCLNCGAPGTSPATSSSSTTTNKDGSGTTTGSTTTTTDQSCTNNSCNTTTTTTNKDGSGATTGTSTSTVSTNKTPGQDPVSEFCRVNPDSPICKGSSFAGTCAGAFTCDGDAIQCAIAKEQHIRDCTMFDKSDATSTLASDIIAGNDPLKTQMPWDASQKTTTPIGSLTGKPRFLSGTCPGDQTFTVGGRSIVMPWSELCTPMTWVGVIAVALTLLVGVRIALGD